MIPILYESTETEFTTNGLCRLIDCTSCLVTEKRNGLYEVEFKYPTSGRHFADITRGRIIAVSHDEQGDIQPFVIYRCSAPLNGVCTYNARHVSYELNNVVVTPFTAQTAAEVFLKYVTYATSNLRFTFWTDNTTAGTFKLKTPAAIRATLGGMDGSVLDTYGGEYEWDKFAVKNHAHRGADNNVTIRYGKNLTSMTHVTDSGELYNAIVPYWTDPDGDCVYGSLVQASGTTETICVAHDFSQDFESKPTAAQLNSAAQSFLTANTPWIPKVSITLDFVALWQTEEYKEYANLERVRLCDTVHVLYPEMNVSISAKVVRVVWDALLERYKLIELGDARSSLSSTITKAATATVKAAVHGLPTRSSVQAAIEEATAVITGSSGGHLVIKMDANDEPSELLIMDTTDENTAVQVLRINMDGIGFSSNGVNGPFTTAWTLDGHFVANFIDTGTLNAALITTGTMLADRILGGTLTLGGRAYVDSMLYS